MQRRGRALLCAALAASLLAAGVAVSPGRRLAVPAAIAPAPAVAARTVTVAGPEVEPTAPRVVVAARTPERREGLDGSTRVRETEHTWLERDLAAERRSPGTLVGEAHAILDGVASDTRKVALLRAVCAADVRDADAVLIAALRVRSRVPVGHGEGPGAVAIQLLCERASARATARAALRTVAVPETPLPPAYRRRAVAALAAHGDAADRVWLRAVLEREPAPELLAVAAQAEGRED